MSAALVLGSGFRLMVGGVSVKVDQPALVTNYVEPIPPLSFSATIGLGALRHFRRRIVRWLGLSRGPETRAQQRAAARRRAPWRRS